MGKKCNNQFGGIYEILILSEDPKKNNKTKPILAVKFMNLRTPWAIRS